MASGFNLPTYATSADVDGPPSARERPDQAPVPQKHDRHESRRPKHYHVEPLEYPAPGRRRPPQLPESRHHSHHRDDEQYDTDMEGQPPQQRRQNMPAVIEYRQHELELR